LEEFSREQSEDVPGWKSTVDDFETGASQVNPYELPKSGKLFLFIETQSLAE
jgi:hypothetical protein